MSDPLLDARAILAVEDEGAYYCAICGVTRAKDAGCEAAEEVVEAWEPFSMWAPRCLIRDSADLNDTQRTVFLAQVEGLRVALDRTRQQEQG